MKPQSHKIDTTQSFRLSIETQAIWGKIIGAVHFSVVLDRDTRRPAAESGQPASPACKAANEAQRYRITWESSTPPDWQEQGIGMSM